MMMAHYSPIEGPLPTAAPGGAHTDDYGYSRGKFGHNLLLN